MEDSVLDGVGKVARLGGRVRPGVGIGIGRGKDVVAGALPSLGRAADQPTSTWEKLYSRTAENSGIS